MNNKSCSIRPIPYFDESPGSLLIRTAEANGHNHGNHIIGNLENIGVGRYTKVIAMLKRYYIYQKIFTELGIVLKGNLALLPRNFVDQRSVPEISHLMKSKTFFIRGAEVPLALLRDDTRTYCPECLVEKPYFRDIWLFQPYTTCHIHNKKLLHGCMICGENLKITRGLLCYCNACNHNIVESIGEKGQCFSSQSFLNLLASKDEKKIDAFFECWTLLSKCAPEKLETLSSDITSISLDVAENRDIPQHMLLNIYTEFGEDVHPRVFFFPILRSTNKNIKTFFLKYLDKILIETVKPFKTKCRRYGVDESRIMLGVSSRTFRKILLANDVDFIQIKKKRMISEEELLKLLILKKREPQVHKKNFIDENHLISRTAAEFLGVYEGLFTYLVKVGLIPIAAKKGKSVFFTINTLEQFNEHYITLHTLSTKLDVPPNHLKSKLMYYGAKPVENLTSEYSSSVFIKESTQHISAEMIKSCPRIYHPRPAPSTSPTISEVTARLSLTGTELRKLIKDGLLIKTGSNRSLITQESFDDLLRAINDKNIIPINKAAEIFNISTNYISSHYFASGLLDKVEIGPWVFVSKKSFAKLIKLRKKFITAKEFKINTGLSSGTLALICARHKLKKARLNIGRKIIFLYDRSELTKLFSGPPYRAMMLMRKGTADVAAISFPTLDFNH